MPVQKDAAGWQDRARQASLQGLARIRQPVQLLVGDREPPQPVGGSAFLSIYRFEQRDYQRWISARFKHWQYRRYVSLGEVRVARQPPRRPFRFVSAMEARQIRAAQGQKSGTGGFTVRQFIEFAQRLGELALPLIKSGQ